MRYLLGILFFTGLLFANGEIELTDTESRDLEKSGLELMVVQERIAKLEAQLALIQQSIRVTKQQLQDMIEDQGVLVDRIMDSHGVSADTHEVTPDGKFLKEK